mmetsp:Transcript_164840/g.316499  ORF Transcript_164840/g.316499 Transcript_164840/m.316499 type:complete len:925 (+) Transcript_164840:91-2865(+)
MGMDGIGRVSAEELRKAVTAAMLETVNGGSNVKDEGEVPIVQQTDITIDTDGSSSGEDREAHSAGPKEEEVPRPAAGLGAGAREEDVTPKHAPEDQSKVITAAHLSAPPDSAVGDSALPARLAAEIRNRGAESPAAKFDIGERVAYWSGTHNQWMEARVTRQYFDASGHLMSYDLDVKRGAQAAKIRRLSQTGELPSDVDARPADETQHKSERSGDGQDRLGSKASADHPVANSEGGLPAQAPNEKHVESISRFQVGEHIEYWSDTYQQWMPAVVESVRKDGTTYDLDVKRGARDRKMRSINTVTPDAAPAIAGGQLGLPIKKASLSRGPSPLPAARRGLEVAGYPASDGWDPSPLAGVGQSARRGQSPVTAHVRGSRAESVPVTGEPVQIGRPVLEQAFKRGSSPVSGRRRASSIDRPPEVAAPAVVHADAQARGEALPPYRAAQPPAPGVLTTVAENSASANVIASPQAQPRLAVIGNARGSPEVQVQGGSSVHHPASVSVGVIAPTLSGKSPVDQNSSAISQNAPASVGLPIAPASAGAKNSVMMLWDGEKVVMRQLTGGDKSPPNMRAPHNVFVCPQANDSSTAPRQSAQIVHAPTKGVETSQEASAAAARQSPSIYVNGQAVSAYAVRVRSRSTTREYPAGAAGPHFGAPVTTVPNMPAGGGVPSTRLGALEVDELEVGDGPFDPNESSVYGQLLSKIGYERGSKVEEMTGFRGGLNEGVWFLTDSAAGSRPGEAKKPELVLKLVKGTRSHEKVPTEAESFIKMFNDHPGIQDDTHLTFPLKIFSCIRPGKVKIYDLIIMKKAPGVRLTEHIARMRFKQEAEAIFPVFSSLGIILGEFHLKYGKCQHGDFQPSNVLFDEVSGKISLIDIGGMGSNQYESDIEHFANALQILKRNYSGDLLDQCQRHFEAGYAKATAGRC